MPVINGLRYKLEVALKLDEFQHLVVRTQIPTACRDYRLPTKLKLAQLPKNTTMVRTTHLLYATKYTNRKCNKEVARGMHS